MGIKERIRMKDTSQNVSYFTFLLLFLIFIVDDSREPLIRTL